MTDLPMFTATFNMPGLHDSVTFAAVDMAAAEKRASEIAEEPWRDWPTIEYRRGRTRITVELAIK